MTEVNLPETVEVCGLCRGYGFYGQRFLEGNSTAACDFCRGAQFMYAGSRHPVSASVRNQIAVANGLLERHPALCGLGAQFWPLWPSDSKVDDWHLVPTFACYEIASEWPEEPKKKEGPR